MSSETKACWSCDGKGYHAGHVLCFHCSGTGVVVLRHEKA